MRAPSLLVVLLATSTLAACGGGDAGDDPGTGPTPPGTAALIDTVFMPGDVFSPPSLTLQKGGTVWFDFPARAHNVIFSRRIEGAPADIQPTSSRLVSRTFANAGTFPYDCTLHPGMTGEIVVR
jgi:plastocyanin